MGTIASVLQWTCTSCNLINPTESLKCINCGNNRRIRFDRVVALDYDSSDSSFGSIEKASQHHQSNDTALSTNKLTTATTITATAAATTNTATYTKEKSKNEISIDIAEDSRGENNGDENGQQPISTATSTTINDTTNSTKLLHKTLPGYVEINSNGYNIDVVSLFF